MARTNLGRIMQKLLELLRKHDEKPVLRKALQQTVDEANKQGPRRQLQMLIDKIGEDETEKALTAILQEEDVLRETSHHVEAYDLRDKVICLVYEHYMREAHHTVMKGLLPMLRVLAEKGGARAVQVYIDEMIEKAKK